MMFRVVLLFYLFASGTESFHLYNTYTSDNHDYKDCLYSFTLNTGVSREWLLIPYCIRQNMPSSDESDAQYYTNQTYTFDQLKSKNVSSYDLYSWHAPIDTINYYQRYLLGENMSLNNHSYCNCSGEISIHILVIVNLAPNCFRWLVWYSMSILFWSSRYSSYIR
jgi:hypothetical protein